MRNRYAAGALAVSAGLSVYTLIALPRGGVARSWTTSTPPAALHPAAPPVARLKPLAAPLASRTSAGAAPRPGAFFPRRPAAPAARRPQPERRPDLSALIVAGRGADRVVGSSGDGGIGETAPLGTLQGFQWQQGPRVRDDAPEASAR